MNPGWPQIHSVAKADLQLRIFLSLPSNSGITVCTTMLSQKKKKSNRKLGQNNLKSLVIPTFKAYQLGVGTHTCEVSTQDMETELLSSGQPGPHRETLNYKQFKIQK